MLKKIIQPQSVFFIDLDDTLINTHYANYLAYQQAAKIFGYCLPSFCPQKRFNRHSLHENFPHLPPRDYHGIIIEKEKNFPQFLPQTSINSALLALIKEHYKTHKMYLISNSRRERVFLTLQYHNLLSFFSQVFTHENFQEKNKYHSVIEKLNIPAHFILLFEDDPREIAYAIAAGIPENHIFSPHFGD